MNQPRTIQIFLPDGSPTSIKEAEIKNRLVKAIMFPRKKLEELAKREIAQFTGVYFLFGEQEEGAKPTVYIGEGENCFDRIKEHNRNRGSWTHGVIVATKTNEYTKTEGKFLEHYCLKFAMEAGRFKMENNTGSREPSLPESRKFDLLDNFETIKILLGTLGYPLLDSKDKTKVSSKEFLYINFKGIAAKGSYIDEGFIVYSGSQARKDHADSFRTTQIIFKNKLLSDKVLEEISGKIVFKQDFIFSSPSAASDMIKGNSSNGWIEWKDKNGITLDQLKRQ